MNSDSIFWLALALVITVFMLVQASEHRTHHQCIIALVELDYDLNEAIPACEEGTTRE